MAGMPKKIGASALPALPAVASRCQTEGGDASVRYRHRPVGAVPPRFHSVAPKVPSGFELL